MGTPPTLPLTKGENVFVSFCLCMSLPFCWLWLSFFILFVFVFVFCCKLQLLLMCSMMGSPPSLLLTKGHFLARAATSLLQWGGHPSLATMMLRCSQKKSNLPLCWGAMLEQSNLVGHKNTEDFRSDFKSKICYRYHGLACQNYPKQLPTPSNQHTARNIEQTRRNILYDICLILISCGQWDRKSVV